MHTVQKSQSCTELGTEADTLKIRSLSDSYARKVKEFYDHVSVNGPHNEETERRIIKEQIAIETAILGYPAFTIQSLQEKAKAISKIDSFNDSLLTEEQQTALLNSFKAMVQHLEHRAA